MFIKCVPRKSNFWSFFGLWLNQVLDFPSHQAYLTQDVQTNTVVSIDALAPHGTGLSWLITIAMMTSSNGKKNPRYWSFVRGIHRSPVTPPHKGQWRGVLMFSLICAWINSWVNTREAGDLRRNFAYYDVSVMPHIIASTVLGTTH